MATEDRGTEGGRRGPRAALKVILHLAAAADHEALLRLLDPVERAARDL
jgi:hypothetical protein